MLIFTTHNYLLFTRKEIWFYNNEPYKKGVYNVFSATKINDGREEKFFEKYSTILIDLRLPEEDLFKNIQSRYRNYIKAAEKQGLNFVAVTNPTENDCVKLALLFNKFATNKQIRPLSSKWLMTVAKTGNLCFTSIKKNDIDVVIHIFIHDGKNILLTQTFNNVNFENERVQGDANKLLHWKDIQLFKQMGFHFYDLGGINLQKLPGISKFKSNFGGEVTEYYRYIKTPFWLYSFFKLYKKIVK